MSGQGEDSITKAKKGRVDRAVCTCMGAQSQEEMPPGCLSVCHGWAKVVCAPDVLQPPLGGSHIRDSISESARQVVHASKTQLTLHYPSVRYMTMTALAPG